MAAIRAIISVLFGLIAIVVATSCFEAVLPVTTLAPLSWSELTIPLHNYLMQIMVVGSVAEQASLLAFMLILLGLTIWARPSGSREVDRNWLMFHRSLVIAVLSIVVPIAMFIAYGAGLGHVELQVLADAQAQYLGGIFLQAHQYLEGLGREVVSHDFLTAMIGAVIGFATTLTVIISGVTLAWRTRPMKETNGMPTTFDPIIG